jgi:acyl-CoA dehydrogenase
MIDVIIPLLTVVAVAVAVLIGVRPVRRALISRPIFGTYKKILPQMSDTEREALEAGTVWWDGELFRGNPDWNKMLAYPVPKLTAAEQSFMDNEVEEACRLVDDWKVSHETQDMTPEAWKYVKRQRISRHDHPEEAYGGLEFFGIRALAGGDQVVDALLRLCRCRLWCRTHLGRPSC